MKKIALALLTTAILMIGAGIYQDEAAIVLNKGINLCLECVGIG